MPTYIKAAFALLLAASAVPAQARGSCIDVKSYREELAHSTDELLQVLGRGVATQGSLIELVVAYATSAEEGDAWALFVAEDNKKTCLTIGGNYWQRKLLAHERSPVYRVKQGDTAWSLLAKHVENDLAGLNDQQQRLVVNYLEDQLLAHLARDPQNHRMFGFRSSNINAIWPGDTLNFAPLFPDQTTLEQARRLILKPPAAIMWGEPLARIGAMPCYPEQLLTLWLAQQALQTKTIVAAVRSESFGVLEIFAAPSGEWTAIVSNPQGFACKIKSGTGWETFNKLKGRQALGGPICLCG